MQNTYHLSFDRAVHLLVTSALAVFAGGCVSWGPGHPPNAPDAAEVFIVGGGGHPHRNQVSLEKNVLFFQRMLADSALPIEQTLFFTGGNEGHAILQTRDEEATLPEMNQLLARAVGPTSDLRHRYRPHTLGPVDEVPSPEAIGSFFDELAARAVPPSGVLMYYTGHGGKGPGNKKWNTSMSLWNRKAHRVDALCAQLDQLNPETPLMLLMVQCYAGGFSHVIWNEGDPEKGLSPHARFGFFSTVADRPAAGCTPDIDEANYREYSTYFLEALYGTSRLGEAVTPPDIDGDGAVCFDEAHAYALVESTTIDVSVRTSDALLRHYSKVGDEEDGLLDTGSFAEVMAAAGSYERFVLVELSDTLKLKGDERVGQARKVAEVLETRRKKIDGRRKVLHAERKKLQSGLRRELSARWPLLVSPWHPDVPELLDREGDAIRDAITGHTDYARFAEVEDELEEKGRERVDLDRQWARHTRFIRAAEHVAMAANIEQVAEPQIVQRYRELKRLEQLNLAELLGGSEG